MSRPANNPRAWPVWASRPHWCYSRTLFVWRQTELKQSDDQRLRVSGRHETQELIESFILRIKNVWKWDQYQCLRKNEEYLIRLERGSINIFKLSEKETWGAVLRTRSSTWSLQESRYGDLRAIRLLDVLLRHFRAKLNLVLLVLRSEKQSSTSKLPLVKHL